MIDLPSNVTTAALALVLGAVLGAGGCYYFLHEEPQSDLAKLGEMEGQSVLERVRSIAPEDTSGQEEADVEIRYKTKRDTVYEDTLRVPVPKNLPSQPLLSGPTPISVTQDRVTWTYWDPAARQYRQQVHAVPQDAFSLHAHALLRAYAPLRNVSLAAERTFVGVGISARWRRSEASVSGLTTPTLSRQRVSVGLRWKL